MPSILRFAGGKDFSSLQIEGQRSGYAFAEAGIQVKSL
jgi:hypothetical protein